MTNPLDDLSVSDGDLVRAGDIPRALTAAPLLYDDGATQTFDDDGATVYVENGRPTVGEWYLDERGSFCSFWPPSYRACYDLQWVVESGRPVGLRFGEGSYAAVGRYRFDS